MVDTWSKDGCVLKILSPTAAFNEQKKGPDQLFNDILLDTNQLDRGLALTRENIHAGIDGYFHRTFGVEYGVGISLQGLRTWARSLTSATRSVKDAQALLDRMCETELEGLQPEPSNSVQVHAYMEGMNLGWHVDGDGDLGETVATLSLGGDAEMVIRAKGNADEGLLHDLLGTKGDEEQRLQARIRIPLIHGSIIIMHGDFDSQFEHKVDCKGPLRFAVTARTVNESARTEMLALDSDDEAARPNGQIFVDSSDESDGDDEAEDDLFKPARSNTELLPPRPSFPQPTATYTQNRTSTYDRRPPPRPASRSPPTHRRPRSTATTKYKDPGWTQHQKDKIFNWKRAGMNYKQIADRCEREFANLEGKVNPDNLRMVVNREKTRRKKYAEVFGEEDNASQVSSLGPSDSASATAAAGNKQNDGDDADGMGGYDIDPNKWTAEEVDRLLGYRNQDPPMPYKDIRELEGNNRTEKAYREQMTTQNRKRRGEVRNRKVGAGGGGVGGRQSMPRSPLGRVDGPSAQGEERNVRPDVQIGGLDLLPPPSLGRSGRASRSQPVREAQTPAATTGRASRSSRAAQGGRQGSGGDAMVGVENTGPAARPRTRSRANIGDDMESL